VRRDVVESLMAGMWVNVIIIIAVVALMIFINALYVAAEFATVAARKSRLKQMAASGHRLARMLVPVVEDPKALDDYIAACQLGITASSLVLGAYGQSTVARAIAPTLAGLGRLAEPAALAASATGVLILLTILQVVLGELFPKSVAIQYREQVALTVVVPMRWSVVAFRPFIWLFNGSANFLLQRLGVAPSAGHAHVHSPEEIELLVAESRKGGLLDSEAERMLRNALHFRDLTARHVMTPRVRLVAAPAEATVAEVLTRATESGFTRLPIYRNTVDDILGLVHVKDLFRLYLEGRNDVAAVLRPATFVPESLPIPEVWATLKSKREYLAIVLDEYGGTAGLVTLEDLIEEIFGELQDEFDRETALISADKAGRLHLRGDLLVSDVNEFLGLRLPEDQADTLGGLVMSALGRIPEAGDEVTLGAPATVIRVEKMEARGVAEVSLRLPDGKRPRLSGWEAAGDD
jgi:CBS domain containing-hemolysin-like protein